MNLLAVALLLYAVHCITCTEHENYNKDKGLLFDAFPESILSFPIHTKDIQQQTTQVPDKMECVSACIGVPWCQSMNFKNTAQNNGLHVCELLSTDKHTHPNNMAQNNTFTHLSIKNPCEENPCLNGGTCSLQNNRQEYRCQCKTEFDGNKCQNDVNECSTGAHNCNGTFRRCINTIGSFYCLCDTGEGYSQSGDVRLTGGSYNNEGIVEVYHNDLWGTVCDDEWDINDARVLCRQLGFSGAQSAPRSAGFCRGTGKIWLDDVNCVGNENRLQDCSHAGWGTHDCNHGEDAGVVCIT